MTSIRNRTNMSTDWKKYKKKFILPLIVATGIIFLLHCSSSKSECGKTDANCNYFSSILIQALNSSTDNPGLTLSPQPGSYGYDPLITITKSTGQGTLRYTSDGSIPTCTTGATYSAPILIDSLGDTNLNILLCDGTRELGRTSGKYTLTFLPTQVNGLRLWLKADSLLSLSNNSVVQTWKDLSGNSNQMTALSSASPPIFKTLSANTINGRSIVSFNGGQSFINNAPTGFPMTSPVSCFVVTNPRGLNSPTFILNSGPSAAGPPPAGTSRQIAIDASNRFSLNTTPGTNTFMANANLNNYYIFGVTHTANVSTFYLNGINVGTSGATLTPIGAQNTLSIGGNSTIAGGNYFSGEIAEILFYDNSISASDVTSVHCYLGKKYGFTISGCP